VGCYSEEGSESHRAGKKAELGRSPGSIDEEARVESYTAG
jgi:hypothetical protein